MKSINQYPEGLILKKEIKRNISVKMDYLWEVISSLQALTGYQAQSWQI